MSERSFWQRIGSWFRGGATPAGPALPEPAGTDMDESPAGMDADASMDTAVAEPRHLRPEEEMWLEALIADVGEAQRLWAIGNDEFWQRIDILWQRGHERLAIEWVEKFIAAPATPREKSIALRARLIELYDKRGDLRGAVAHLETLRDVDEYAVRANYLLGEHYRRQGDEARALRHYEAVLARDMDYPNVRARVERLRQRRGRSAPLNMGETIAGAEALGVASGARYHLVRELGRGATGVVYLARDTELERDVAVKLLHPHLATADRARACARFFEEARICASLRHPNIMAVLDMDERARRIVMELAAGGTLRRVLQERGPRPVRRALERHAQILSALAATHHRGVVHRDLKPGNLMFRRDPDEPGAEIVLGDFGVAHLPDIRGATGVDSAMDKKPAEALGTLAYMAPEQRLGGDIDPRCDLYAAAVVLYEMLTGQSPWSRDVLLAGTRTRDDFRLPAEVLEGTPADLAADLQDHLTRLGDPDARARPDTPAALQEARRLRDIAIAETRAA